MTAGKKARWTPFKAHRFDRIRSANMRALACLISIASVSATAHAGDDPPKGAPWFTKYETAAAHAIATNTPIFVYFTKTY